MYLMLDYFIKQGTSPSVTIREGGVILMYDHGYKQTWPRFLQFSTNVALQTTSMGFEGIIPTNSTFVRTKKYGGTYPLLLQV